MLSLLISAVQRVAGASTQCVKCIEGENRAAGGGFRMSKRDQGLVLSLTQSSKCLCWLCCIVAQELCMMRLDVAVEEMEDADRT